MSEVSAVALMWDLQCNSIYIKYPKLTDLNRPQHKV